MTLDQHSELVFYFFLFVFQKYRIFDSNYPKLYYNFCMQIILRLHIQTSFAIAENDLRSVYLLLAIQCTLQTLGKFLKYFFQWIFNCIQLYFVTFCRNRLYSDLFFFLYLAIIVDNIPQLIKFIQLVFVIFSTFLVRFNAKLVKKTNWKG